MENMPPHATGFRREVLAEIEFAQKHLMALAAAVPAEDYGWSPAEDARSFAAVLVHVATTNLLLLDRAGARPPDVVDLYEGIEGDRAARLAQMVHKNIGLEQTMTAKAAVIDLLARSFAAVKECWCAASEEALWATAIFLGERETARQIYLRILAHAHEHMGQAIAYVRAMGYRVPWEDPQKNLDEIETALLAR
jgi:uncharacterized damage-inducible protein DinB